MFNFNEVDAPKERIQIVAPKWGKYWQDYATDYDPINGALELIDNSADAIKKENPKKRVISVVFQSARGVLTISDTGCGFGETLDEIKEVFNLNDSIKANDSNTIGTHNVGLIASAFLLGCDGMLKDNTAKVSIVTITNKHKSLIEFSVIRKSEIPPEINYTDLGETDEANGTTVTVYGVNFKVEGEKKSKFNKFVEAINYRYYKDIVSGSLIFDVNGTILNGKDRMEEEKLLDAGAIVTDNIEKYKEYLKSGQPSIFKRHYNFDGEKVETTIASVDGILKRNANVNLSAIGVEINGVRVFLGGKNSWKHIGRSYHSTLNKVRVNISFENATRLKRLITSHIKSKEANELYKMKILGYDWIKDVVIKEIQEIITFWEAFQNQKKNKSSEPTNNEKLKVYEELMTVSSGIISDDSFIPDLRNDFQKHGKLGIFDTMMECFQKMHIEKPRIARLYGEEKEKRDNEIVSLKREGYIPESIAVKLNTTLSIVNKALRKTKNKRKEAEEYSLFE